MRSLLIIVGVLLIVVAEATFAQQTITVTTDEMTLSLPPTLPDARTIGRGKTGVADNTEMSDMAYNPASLATPRTTFEVLGIQAGLPPSTLDAISFLSKSSTIQQYKTGDFYKKIYHGANSVVQSLQNGTAVDPAAISEINSGLRFTAELQDKVLGTTDQPLVHGVTVLPTIRGQMGHWGFSLSGTVRAGFASTVTEPLSKLYQLQLPQDFSSLPINSQLALAGDMLDAISPLINPQTGELNYLGAIPQTFAVAYVDIAATIGYGREILPGLQAGADLKIVNRRLSTKIIDPDHYDGILSEVRTDLSKSATGVTLDLGAIYTIRATGTKLGLTLQNIIPLPAVRSTAELSLVFFDQNYNVIKVIGRIPFAMTSPFLANCGASQEILHGWRVYFDWVDMFSRDEMYENYGQRFRLGTDYRLETGPNGLAVIGRVGVAEKKFAFGAGFDFWRFVRVDGAYGYDTLLAANSWFASISFGF